MILPQCPRKPGYHSYDPVPVSQEWETRVPLIMTMGSYLLSILDGMIRRILSSYLSSYQSEVILSAAIRPVSIWLNIGTAQDTQLNVIIYSTLSCLQTNHWNSARACTLYVENLQFHTRDTHFHQFSTVLKPL